MKSVNLEKEGLPSSATSTILPLLEKAALEGMAYECDIAVMPLLEKLNNDNKSERNG